MATANLPRLELRQLLSTCLALSGAACIAIREVQLARESKVNSQIAMQRRWEWSLDAGQRGPRYHLERRLRSQICTDLGRHSGTGYHLERNKVGKGGAVESIRMECRDAFGSKLTFVGEEDQPSKEVKVSALAEEKLPDDFVIPEDLQSLIVSDITVFIDPLDGTREFVEGRLEAVTSLVGVSYRGRAIAGIMGIPFHQSGQVQVVLGVVGSPSGLLGVPMSGQKKSEANEFVLAISMDLGAKEVNAC